MPLFPGIFLQLLRAIPARNAMPGENSYGEGLLKINPETCIGCGRCIPYCPVRAIEQIGEEHCVIREDDCVECGVCLRSSECPTSSFEQPPVGWPRCLRAEFSDPLVEHGSTRAPGRGTEEMKTNDITNRYKVGQVGLLIEAGRPGIGARFGEVQLLTSALASAGARIEPDNPLYQLLMNPARGLLRPEILDEKVLSVIIECCIDEFDVPRLLAKLREIESSIPIVFTVGIVRRLPHGSQSIMESASSLGLPVLPHGKVNLGLGRPFYEGNAR